MKKALLIFCKEPLPYRVKTRLSGWTGSAAAFELYKAMLLDCANTVAKLDDVDLVWWVDGDPEVVRSLTGSPGTYRKQPKGNLGAKMTKAFAVAFEEGYNMVAAIGTDSPAMDPGDILSLYSAIENGANATIIPSGDGGYSGIALDRRFDGVFKRIRWSSPHTLSDTMKRLGEEWFEVFVLGDVFDIDDRLGLESMIRFVENSDGAPHTREALARLGMLSACIPDDLLFAVPLDPAPNRIVSLIPSVTEFLFDLDLGDKVVGRTDYCISPREMCEVASIGGPKTPDLQKILSLKPDLVIADAEENRKEDVMLLKERGVRVFTALPRNLWDVASFMRRVARLCRVEGKERKYVDKLLGLLPKAPPKTSALCLVWKDPYMAASPETLIDGYMAAVGLNNLAPGKECYPKIMLEDIQSLSPQVVLLPSEPYPFDDKHRAEIQNALPSAKVLTFPGEWVTWYGARSADRLEALKHLLS